MYRYEEEIMKLRPYSSALLALCGFILMSMGFYFVFLRPPLLPEDMRFLDTSLPMLQQTFPHLLLWLHRVFWVMGAFMFTSGLLTLYIARTSFRKRTPGVAGLMTLAGITSIGWMTVVNFLIGSDFIWFLTAVTVLWGLALMLFWWRK